MHMSARKHSYNKRALEDSKVLFRYENRTNSNKVAVKLFIVLISGLCNLEICLFLVVNIVYKSLLFAHDLHLKGQSCAIAQYSLNITHYLASGSHKIAQNSTSNF